MYGWNIVNDDSDVESAGWPFQIIVLSGVTSVYTQWTDYFVL